VLIGAPRLRRLLLRHGGHTVAVRFGSLSIKSNQKYRKPAAKQGFPRQESPQTNTPPSKFTLSCRPVSANRRCRTGTTRPLERQLSKQHPEPVDVAGSATSAAGRVALDMN